MRCSTPLDLVFPAAAQKTVTNVARVTKCGLTTARWGKKATVYGVPLQKPMHLAYFGGVDQARPGQGDSGIRRNIEEAGTCRRNHAFDRHEQERRHVGSRHRD